MLPMLKQGRDSFTVKKKTTQRCRKYDVILYRRPPDSYVLHRVIAVREHDYVVLGDNCINKEYVKDSDIKLITMIGGDRNTVLVELYMWTGSNIEGRTFPQKDPSPDNHNISLLYKYPPYGRSSALNKEKLIFWFLVKK